MITQEFKPIACIVIKLSSKRIIIPSDVNNIINPKIKYPKIKLRDL